MREFLLTGFFQVRQGIKLLIYTIIFIIIKYYSDGLSQYPKSVKQIVGHSSFFFKFWPICDEFGKFCSAIAGKVLFEKSSHTSKNLAKAKENACSTYIQLTFKSPLFHKAHSKQVTRPITSIHIHHDTIILVLSEQIGTHSTYVLSFKIIAISNDNELYLFSP